MKVVAPWCTSTANIDALLAKAELLCHSTNPNISPLSSVAQEAPRRICGAAVAALLGRLSPLQLEAAEAPLGAPLLVLAGPGSGKTSTMVARVAHMLRSAVGGAAILVRLRDVFGL